MRRAERQGTCRFRLTCVTRIFQKNVFTKFAHGSRLAAGVAKRSLARLAIGDGCGTSSCCGSPFPAILTVVALLFSSPHWRRQPKSRVPGHDPRLQKEPKVLKTRQEVDWAAMLSCAADKQGASDGDGSRCFPIVIYNAGCSGSGLQLQPKVERENDWRLRATAQADVSSSFRFAALGMTRHIPYRIERQLAFLRLR